MRLTICVYDKYFIKIRRMTLTTRYSVGTVTKRGDALASLFPLTRVVRSDIRLLSLPFNAL